MDGSSRGYGIYARRHNLGSIKSIQYASVLICRFFLYSFSYNFSISFNRPFLFAVRRRPQVSIKEFSFLEKIFSKTKPEERTWSKLINPDTIHWYCDGPEPMPKVVRNNAKIHKHKSVNLYFA